MTKYNTKKNRLWENPTLERIQHAISLRAVVSSTQASENPTGPSIPIGVIYLNNWTSRHDGSHLFEDTPILLGFYLG